MEFAILGPGAFTLLLMKLVKESFPKASARALFFSALLISGAGTAAYAAWSGDHGPVLSWPTLSSWGQAFAGAMGVHAGIKAVVKNREADARRR